MKDPNFGSLYDLFAATFREPWVVQRFLPKVREGDKRIILVDGVRARRDQPRAGRNDIRSNMVRGGAAETTQLSRRASARSASASARNSSAAGLLFVGIDVIDGNLTEINVTSPTGLRAIKRLGGPDLAVSIWDASRTRWDGAEGAPCSSPHLSRGSRRR